LDGVDACCKYEAKPTQLILRYWTCRALRSNEQAFDSKDHFALHVISVMAQAVPQDDLPAVATDELFDRAVSRCPRAAQGESMQASHPPARTA